MSAISEGGAGTKPADITRAVLASYARSPDGRLRAIMEALVRHLHGFIEEVQLTDEEWRKAIGVLTATGHITDEKRQEWILWSDVLGASMLVDALAHPAAGEVTESTVLGPFYVEGSPLRAYGESLAETDAGQPAWIYGRVLSEDGTPLDAELDVWQNGDNELYAVQDPDVPDDHLRGRFRTRSDGSYGFVAVRPTPYPIPHDGPVGAMLMASGRHPWRPAHVHMIVRAPGHASVATHVFDRASEYIDSDAVFAVKRSLLRDFVAREPDDPQRPSGIGEVPWWSLRSDFVLARATAAGEPQDPGRTA